MTRVSQKSKGGLLMLQITSLVTISTLFLISLKSQVRFRKNEIIGNGPLQSGIVVSGCSKAQRLLVLRRPASSSSPMSYSDLDTEPPWSNFGRVKSDSFISEHRHS